ncbi:MAG: hypothetical protein Q8P32_01410 [Candidatus Komeilibacteria bacterium]|nr:hypothetical protein [Candidatus Komeilibacteria bacterium]
MPEKFEPLVPKKSALPTNDWENVRDGDFAGSPEDASDSQRLGRRGSESKKPGMDDYDMSPEWQDDDKGDRGDERDLEIIRNRGRIVR